jgi:N-acyl-D-aspartate/D-glutamate deacylase
MMLKPMIRVFVTGHTYAEVSEKAKLAIAEFFDEKEENIEKIFTKYDVEMNIEQNNTHEGDPWFAQCFVQLLKKETEKKTLYKLLQLYHTYLKQ